MNPTPNKPETIYDICLVLEGTYPFISGGVSTWAHNLIKNMPEFSFTGVCILPTVKEKWTVKYDVPPNFQDLKVIYLHDYQIEENKKPKKSIVSKQIEILRAFHLKMREKDYSLFNTVIPIFHGNTKGLTPHDMIYGKASWDLFMELYPKDSMESFLDIFWTHRFIHLPLFQLMKTKLPKARVYHSLSTGYAGLLGAIAKFIYRRPYFITEHGIYTKERKIEIAQADWIYVAKSDRLKMETDLGGLQKKWISVFETMGKITYYEADSIITLYEGNRQIEIEYGADINKILIIPNGISIDRFGKLKSINFSKNPEHNQILNVGLVGRVVPIKDVKTFIRACKIVSMQMENIKFYIMGPTDEDQNYYQECTEIVSSLQIQRFIEFTGKINVMDYYPLLHLLVLTSISEAQPLVILEANCVGIPIVASDVGACREMLEGRTPEDKALGHSGIITPVSDPVSTANAIIKILSDHKLRINMAISGQKRVNQLYKESDLHDQYRKIYRNFINS